MKRSKFAQRKKLQFSYDEAEDILTVEGVRYTGGMFRALSVPTPPGVLFRIVSREDDGTIIIEQIIDTTRHHG